MVMEICGFDALPRGTLTALSISMEIFGPTIVGIVA